MVNAVLEDFSKSVGAFLQKNLHEAGDWRGGVRSLLLPRLFGCPIEVQLIEFGARGASGLIAA